MYTIALLVVSGMSNLTPSLPSRDLPNAFPNAVL